MLDWVFVLLVPHTNPVIRLVNPSKIFPLIKAQICSSLALKLHFLRLCSEIKWNIFVWRVLKPMRFNIRLADSADMFLWISWIILCWILSCCLSSVSACIIYQSSDTFFVDKWFLPTISLFSLNSFAYPPFFEHSKYCCTKKATNVSGFGDIGTDPSGIYNYVVIKVTQISYLLPWTSKLQYPHINRGKLCVCVSTALLINVSSILIFMT